MGKDFTRGLIYEPASAHTIGGVIIPHAVRIYFRYTSLMDC
jgi:hypothetical protein